tara:strand:+ start:24288 stop:24578 length:291 start_codon:yes stop_codon:yes gene_type:complete
MHAVERRSAVLNPSLGRTSSAFEAVEMRRKLARKTNRLQAQAPETTRQPRPTAQLYAEGPTLDGESAKRNRVNRLLAGVLFSAVALMTIVVVGGLG